MRIANRNGRACLLVDGLAVDLAAASNGLLPADPADLFDRWDDLVSWASAAGPLVGDPFDETELLAPSPRPRQVFAIGLNYRSHAEESSLAHPDRPPTFTKYADSLTSPFGPVVLPSTTVDWEVELVAVIGRRARGTSTVEAWAHVAGLTVGQDLTDRAAQMAPPMPQFSLSKSHPGFGPTGPWLVTPDELDDPDDLVIACSVNAGVVQMARTSELIFSVPRLVEYLSGIVTLHPGDLIFTGTPAGIGAARRPRQFLRPGDVLESWIEGVGRMRHEMLDTTPPTKEPIDD